MTARGEKQRITCGTAPLNSTEITSDRSKHSHTPYGPRRRRVCDTPPSRLSRQRHGSRPSSQRPRRLLVRGSFSSTRRIHHRTLRAIRLDLPLITLTACLSLVGSLVGPHDQGGQRPFHRGTLYDTHSHSLHDGADSRPLPRLDGVSTLSGLGRHARFGPGAQTMFPRSTGVSASRPPVAAAPPSFQPASGSTFQRFGFIGGASGLGGSGSAGGGTGGMVVQVARAAWAVLAVSSHGGYRLCM